MPRRQDPSNTSHVSAEEPVPAVGGGMAIAFLFTLLLRFQTATFGNDHFTHLSRARQILLGEWPIRDFFDPGQFLHYYMSAAAQLIFGYNLFGEALLTASCIALGAALTFGISSRVSGSRIIGACASLITVVAFPRLYNYPKVLLYVAAIWLAWSYAHLPGPRRLAALALFSIVAFLFRYDHGIYIGAMLTGTLLLLHWPEPRARWRTAVVYLSLCSLLVLPFAAYVHWATGLPEYMQSSLTSARIVRNVALRALGVTVTLETADRPLDNPSESPGDPIDLVEGYLTPGNALAWFTGLTLTLPIVGLVMGMMLLVRRQVPRPEGATMIACAGMCLVITRALLDNNPDARLADVVTPTAVLAAWVAGRWLRQSSNRAAGPVVRRVFKRAALTALFVLTLWSVTTQARFVNKLSDADVFDGPAAASAHFASTYRRLRLRPIDDWAPPGDDRGIQALARYVLRCTSPEDRLLIAGDFAPDVYFYAERAFAGGQVHFMNRWHDSPLDQRVTIARLRGQSVPIVLIGQIEAPFRRRFSEVAAYIDTRYVEVPFLFNGDKPWRVLIDREKTPSGTDARLGLPCYRSPDPE